MRVHEILVEDTAILNKLKTEIKKIAEKAGLESVKCKVVGINRIFDEFVVDVKLPKGVEHDRQFSQIPVAKKFRAMIKERFGEKNLRSRSVVGMIVRGNFNGRWGPFGRFVFQVRGHKGTSPKL